jgi:hypothetical protein
MDGSKDRILGKALATITNHVNETIPHNTGGLSCLARLIPDYVGPVQDGKTIWVYDKRGQPYCSRFIKKPAWPAINLPALIEHYIANYHILPEKMDLYKATEILR